MHVSRYKNNEATNSFYVEIIYLKNIFYYWCNKISMFMNEASNFKR